MTGLIATTMVISATLLPRPSMVSAATQVVSIQRVSLPSTEGSGGSYRTAISADGRYVAFESEASNLVAVDANGVVDIFVRDRQTGEITRVSMDSGGNESDGESYAPSISADGRYVVSQSYATNLVADDTHGVADVFMHDRQTGETIRVSVASDSNQGNGFCNAPSISADGRSVAFESTAADLVASDTDGVSDVFVHDRQTGQTARVSVHSNGTGGNGGSFYPIASAPTAATKRRSHFLSPCAPRRRVSVPERCPDEEDRSPETAL